MCSYCRHRRSVICLSHSTLLSTLSSTASAAATFVPYFTACCRPPARADAVVAAVSSSHRRRSPVLARPSAARTPPRPLRTHIRLILRFAVRWRRMEERSWRTERTAINGRRTGEWWKCLELVRSSGTNSPIGLMVSQQSWRWVRGQGS